MRRFTFFRCAPSGAHFFVNRNTQGDRDYEKILLTAETILSCMTALFGWEKYTHDYVKETVVEADCGKSGLITYTCAYGNTYNETSIGAEFIHGMCDFCYKFS